MILFVSLVFCPVLAAPGARADVILLKSGIKVVGKIRDPGADPLVVETLFGEETIPKSRVARVKLCPTPWELFDKKYEKLNKKNLQDLLDLLDWAKDPDREPFLRSRLRKLYRRILRLDKDNEEARRGLGYVKVGGEWLTKAEARRRRKEEEAARAKAEAARRAEEEKRARLKRAEGDVGLQVEMNKARDERDAEKLTKLLGTEMHVATSKRISIAATFDREGIVALLELGERALTAVGKDLGLGPSYNPGRAGYRGVYHHYYVLPSDRKAMLTYIKDAFGGISESFYKYLMKGGASGLSANGSTPYAVSILHKGLNRKDPLLHNLGHCIVESLQGEGVDPPWLFEGFGMYMSIRFLGNTGTTCTTITKYAADMEIAKKHEAGGWQLLAKEQVTKGFYPRFVSLCVEKLNRMDAKDLARAWSICRFLMEKHPKKFRNFMRYTGTTLKTQVRALKAALDMSPDQLDKAVNDYVLQNF